MRKLLAAIVALAILVALGVVALGMFAGRGPLAGDASTPLDNAKNSALTAAIDASGVKGQIERKLVANRDKIAAAAGMSPEEVDKAIEDLAIEDWQAATLPEGVIESDTISGDDLGFDGQITTYDDPGYISVQVYGQLVTLTIPESAQPYIPLLESL